MQKAEWEDRFSELRSLAYVLRLSPDLTAWLEACEQAQTMGPILDPTMWLRGTDNLAEWQEIGKAIQKCKAEVERIYAAASARKQAVAG